jgi:hypothetical protein
MFNPTQVNSHTGLTLGVYKRLEVYFSGSVADYIKAGAAAPSTGASAGNDNPNPSFSLGGNGPGDTLGSNIEVCELWIFDVEPSPAQKAALNAYVTSRYGAGLV